ncbi:MAG: hypothetical protein DMG41_14765 [Acidobacteria bacterium]|nr:MAG: hypothetical protein DMG41_14765 [Acidobacteriota bacterium]
MFRRVLVGLMLLFAFTIMFVLVTPDPTDDVTAVVRPSILHKAYPRTEPLQKLSVPLVEPSSSQAVIFPLLATKSLPSRLNPSKLVDLLCEYRC